MKWRSSVKLWGNSETAKSIYSVGLVCMLVLSGFGIFSMAMGTPSPLAVVTGNSMIPDLDHGDLVIIQARTMNQIELGDVIVFTAEWYAASPIIHRVVRIIECGDGDRLFLTRGDNNPSNDLGFRTIEDIIGVVLLKIPAIGNVAFVLWTPIGMISVAIIIIFALVNPERIRIRRDSRTGDCFVNTYYDWPI
ncbi:MAG: signal peptidase I [Candidatus Thorarchaeota archaeon]|nr:signal peptidase I [Candidatus Thorarchaeota archaeon]